MFRRLMFLLVILAISGCTSGVPAAGPAGEPFAVRLVMSYRPDVQFAPFYLADARGYFDEAGLEVEFNHLPESEAVQLVGADEIQFAVVSGEQVLLARAQGLPVVYVMAWWQDYPVAIAAPRDGTIESPEDLVGRRVGFPGLYGASYIGYRALLSAFDIPENAVTMDAIGYTQVESLYEGREDAVVVYANNEPIQLEALGFPVRVLRVADYVHLASNGLITNEKTIRERPELVRALVAAILKGVEDAIAQPEAAFENAHDYVEGLAEADQDVQKAVLEASVGFWVAEHLGHSDGDAWTNMQEILLEMGLLDAPLDLQSAYTNEFIP